MSVAVAVGSVLAADPAGGLDRTVSSYIVYGTLTLTGNYGTGSSHGDVIDFSKATGVPGGGADAFKSSHRPKWVTIKENQGSASAGVANAPLGYNFIYCEGTTQDNGLLQITSGTNTEFTQGSAYSGGSPSLNNVVLYFKAEFPFQ